MAPESVPAIEFPAEISFTALPAAPCNSRPLAAADSPLVDQRSSISGCFALFLRRAAGSAPQERQTAPFAAAHSRNREAWETHSRNREAWKPFGASSNKCALPDHRRSQPGSQSIAASGWRPPPRASKRLRRSVIRRRHDAFGNQFI
jgi:hypothetical protein